jgi:site-specific recombinase XerD
MSQEYYLKKINGTFRMYNSEGRSQNKVNQFLVGIETRNLSMETVRSYGYDLLFLLRWLHKNKIIWKRLIQKDVVSFINFQHKCGAKPSSINRRLSTCELYYAFCFNSAIKTGPGVSKSSPFYKGRGYDKNLGLFFIPKANQKKLRVKVPHHLFEVLNPEEIKTFMIGITRYRDQSIVSMMLFCGVRFSEVLNLKIKDIDYLEKKMLINGKGSKQRIVYMSDNLVKLFQDYQKHEMPRGCKNEYFFLILQGKKKGCKMTNAGLRSLFRYRRIISKITKANPHRFRHTFGSAMAGANVSLPILQNLMGHSDPLTTLKYIHLSNPDVSREFTRATKEIYTKYEKKSSTT